MSKGNKLASIKQKTLSINIKGWALFLVSQQRYLNLIACDDEFISESVILGCCFTLSEPL